MFDNLLDRDNRTAALTLGGLALCFGLLGGAVSGRVLFVEKQIVTSVTQIERVAKKVTRIETVEYVTGEKVSVAPLDDRKKACAGAPVRIIRMHTQGNKGDDQQTFVTVQPVGDGYTVVCSKDGFYGDLWKVGDVITITNGVLS